MKKFTLFLSAMLFSLMSLATEVTVSIETYAAANGWKDATQYSSIAMDNIVTITATKTAGDSNNTGKYYVNGQNWRMYQTENPNIVVAAADGYVLTSVTFTYESNKTGIIIDAAGAQVVSEAAYALQNLSSATFGVGNSKAEVTNGQARVTAITVTYNVGEGGGDTPDTPDAPDTPVTGTEITGIQGADATYVADEEFGDYWVFNLYASIDEAEGMYMSPYLYVETYEVYGKTTLNGTYNIYYAEYWKNENEEDLVNTDEMAEEPVGTLTIKNKDNNGNYSFVGSFVGLDGKTYTLNQVVPVTAYEYLGQDEDGYDIYEDLTLSENGSTPDTPDTPDTPNTPDTPVAGAVTFDADVDKGNASEDSSNQTPYTVSKGGVTLDVTKGIIGKYNEECHYRVYQNETLTLTSTVGNIVSVEFTCTANGEEKYGPGNFTVDSGSYTYSGPVGTWTGDAASVVFTASTAQVRASQIVVKIAGGTTGVEDVTTIEIPVKVLKNGQVMILNGENVYNVLGAQVK